MARRAAILAVVALFTACGGGDDPSIAPAEGTSTTAAAVPSEESTVETTASTPAPTSPGGVTTEEPREQPGVDEGPSPMGVPGSYAPVYLRPGRGDRVVVEIASQSGAVPTQSTLDHVTGTLARVTSKEIALVGAGAPPAHDAWTGNDARVAVEAVAATPQRDDHAVLRLLFVHGRWADDKNVLGVAVRADAAILFADAIDEAATPLVGRSSIEMATTTHEVGHLLGLVDLFLDTGRADPEHPGHSPNRESVMYWAVESTLVADLLAGGPPRNFDADDLADLARIRAG